MASRRFAPLFWCQLLSALSDNILKNALGFIILTQLTLSQSGTLIGLAGALFMLPFFLLSALGGDLADCHNKAAVAQKLKLAEIGIAALAGIGMITQSIPILFVALIGFGIISALFGPTKYGILPDHMHTEELPLANALIEGSTFIAILARHRDRRDCGQSLSPSLDRRFDRWRVAGLLLCQHINPVDRQGPPHASPITRSFAGLGLPSKISGARRPYGIAAWRRRLFGRWARSS